MNIGNHYTRLYSLQICSCFSCAVGVDGQSRRSRQCMSISMMISRDTTTAGIPQTQVFEVKTLFASAAYSCVPGLGSQLVQATIFMASDDHLHLYKYCDAFFQNIHAPAAIIK